MALKHAQPGEAVSLRAADNSADGTRALVRTPSFEAIRTEVKAGAEIPAHRVAGRMTIYCLEGRVALRHDTGEVEMGPGDWLYLEGDAPYALSGREDAALLMTFLFDA